MVGLLFVIVIVLMEMSMVRFVIDLMVISLFIMAIFVAIVVEYCFIFICNDWAIVKILRYCRLMSIQTIQYNKFPPYPKSHKKQFLT